MIIDEKVIAEKKQSLQSDLEKLEKSIAEIGEQQKQLQANVFALHGALQQCDQFLGMVAEEKKEDE